MSAALPWFARYVGINFRDGGRDYKGGLDCWGLVRLIFYEERAIQLPSYGEISALELQKIAQMIRQETGGASPWLSVPRPAVCAFDVAVMQRRHAPVHCGVMVNSRECLHIEEKTASVVVPLTHPSLACRAINFYRHRAFV